jgi:hypothetical protein
MTRAQRINKRHDEIWNKVFTIQCKMEMMEALKMAQDVLNNMTSIDFAQGKDKPARDKVNHVIEIMDVR